MEIFFVGLLGLLAGAIAGLLPGIGPSSLMLAVFPFLYRFNLAEIFTFYFAMMTSTQYYGSVIAIACGVPGEISSMPAVKYGHPLFREGHGSQALMQTATGSFIGSLIAIVLLGIVLHYSFIFSFFFKNSVKVLFVLSAITIMIALSPSRWVSFTMAVLGFVVGKIGYDSMWGGRILTLNIAGLDAGIPFYPLFMGFIVVPILWHYTKNPIRIEFDVSRVRLNNRFKYLTDRTYIKSMVRGSIIGFIVGLIPGASYTVSSNLASTIENKMNNDAMANIVSAETANNAGSISVLLPLLMFAIPIVPSEALVLSVAQMKGFSSNSIMFMTYFWYIILGLVVINFVNWLLSGVLIGYILRFNAYLSKSIYIIALSASGVILCYSAYMDHQIELNAVVFVLALFAAKMVKSLDSRFIFIFAFFLSDLILDEVYRFYVLNF